MSGTAVRTLKEASITDSGLNPECLIEIRWKVPSETNVELHICVLMLSWHKCGVDRCSAPFAALGCCATSHFLSPARAHIAPAMKTASPHHYRTLPIFCRFFNYFSTCFY